MKLIRTFEISQDEFYDYLEEELLKDLSKSLNRQVKTKEIKKGFTYKKKETGTTITIDEYIRGEKYIVTAKSITEFIRISYLTKVTNLGLEITFEQYLSNYDPIRNQKKWISRTFNDWICFGRMSNTLYGMRTAIINKREGIIQKEYKAPDTFKFIREKIESKLEEKKHD